MINRLDRLFDGFNELFDRPYALSPRTAIALGAILLTLLGLLTLV